MLTLRAGWPLAHVIIATVLLWSGCSSQQPKAPAEPPELPQFRLDAIPEVARADIEEAFAEARKNSSDAASCGRLGMILHAYKQYETAAPCYERAHAFAPDEFRWAYYLGTVRFLLGQDEAAVEPLRQALNLNSEYLPARIKLAQILFSLEDYEASEQEYRAALSQEPTSALAHYGLGRVISARDGAAAAIKQYRRACDLSPTFGAAHYALAQAYRAAGDNEKADTHLAMFEQYRSSDEPIVDPLLSEIAALERNPANDHFQRGLALADAGDIDAAIQAFEEAVRADPNLVQPRVNLISLYGGLDRAADVEKHYRAVAEKHPNQGSLHYNYGAFQADQDRFGEAEKAFRRAIKADPAMAEAHSILGQTLEAQQEVAEAEKYYRLAVQIKPAFRLAHFNLGRVLFAQDKMDEGLQHFLKTLTPEDEETPRYMLDVAVAYARTGDIPNARRYALLARERSGKLKQSEVAALSNEIIEKLGGEGR
ncbi:MAG: tetratricopeptide repeat protein [Acidobacteria bacterium]|nr:tetratricopeptide repeat protein [Acidobacteriota bacterium]